MCKIWHFSESKTKQQKKKNPSIQESNECPTSSPCGTSIQNPCIDSRITNGVFKSGTKIRTSEHGLSCFNGLGSTFWRACGETRGVQQRLCLAVSVLKAGAGSLTGATQASPVCCRDVSHIHNTKCPTGHTNISKSSEFYFKVYHFI